MAHTSTATETGWAVSKASLSVMLMSGLALWALPAERAIADKESHDQTVEIANGFADCSAYWQFLSEFSLEQNKPAAAEGMRNLANGAKTTALYFLAMEWTLSHPNEPRTYGSFSPQIDGRIDTSLVRFRAMAEMNDAEGIEAQGHLCQGLTSIQEETIQKIRDASANNPAPSE